MRGLSAEGFTVIDSPRPELYEWEYDPLQNQDLAKKKPEQLKSHLKTLNELLTSLYKPDIAAKARSNITEETRQKLESLGYLSLVGPNESASDKIVKIGGINPADHKFFQYKLSEISKLMAEEKHDQAISSIETFLKFDQENNWLLLLKGTVFYMQRNKEKARQVFLQILENRPHFVYALEKIAVIEFETGKLDEAEKYCRKAIEIFPDHTEMYHLLAKIMLSRDDWEGAKKMLQIEVEKAPTEVKALELCFLNKRII